MPQQHREPNQHAQAISLIRNEAMQAAFDNGMEGSTGMTLAEFLDLIAEHIFFVVASVLLGAVAAFAITYWFIPAEYEATSKVYVVNASSSTAVDLSDLQIGASLTGDYRELLVVRPLLESLIENLGLTLTPEEVKAMVSVANPASTHILNISVVATDPLLAANIANEMANQSVSFLPEIMECEEPNIAESAVVPTQKVGPNYVMNTLVGAMAMLFVAVAVLVLHDMLDDALTSPKDLEELFGAAPLATIPETRLSSQTARHYSHAEKRIRLLRAKADASQLTERTGR